MRFVMQFFIPFFFLLFISSIGYPLNIKKCSNIRNHMSFLWLFEFLKLLFDPVAEVKSVIGLENIKFPSSCDQIVFNSFSLIF